MSDWQCKTGCPQNKKNEGKEILLLDFELFIGGFFAKNPC